MNRPLYIIQFTEVFDDKKYWCGSKKFSKEVKDAKVFVNLNRCHKKAEEILNGYPWYLFKEYKILEIEIKVKSGVAL